MAYNVFGGTLKPTQSLIDAAVLTTSAITDCQFAIRSDCVQDSNVT